MKTTLLALALLLAACINAGYPPPAIVPPEYTACESAADCVVVELGCCDACNGGEARSVNAEHEDEVRTRYSEVCSIGMGCTEMGCAPWQTTCEDNICGLARDDF